MTTLHGGSRDHAASVPVPLHYSSTSLRELEQKPRIRWPPAESLSSERSNSPEIAHLQKETSFGLDTFPVRGFNQHPVGSGGVTPLVWRIQQATPVEGGRDRAAPASSFRTRPSRNL